MREHIYIGWKVTLPNGNDVNFTDQKEATKYFGTKGKEINITRTTVQCGLKRGRKFCGHCTEATYTTER